MLSVVVIFCIACSLRQLCAQPGANCMNPIIIPHIPYIYIGSTCGMGNDFAGLCGESDMQGEDMVFSFTSLFNQCLYINATGTPSFRLYYSTLCGSGCIEDFTANSQGIIADKKISITAAITYYFIIDIATFGCYDFSLALDYISTDQVMVNDQCDCALPLVGTASNYGANDTGEPDSWAPNNFGEECPGGSWSGNQNGVWYSFNNPVQQDVEIIVYNIDCVDGGNGAAASDQLQMGIWTNHQTCDLGDEDFITCMVATGTSTFDLQNLPAGDYYLFTDGYAGDQCTWNFLGNIIPAPCENDFDLDIIGGQSLLGVSSYISNSGSAGNIGSGTAIEEVCLYLVHTDLSDLHITLCSPDDMCILLADSFTAGLQDLGNVGASQLFCFTPAGDDLSTYGGSSGGSFAPVQPFSLLDGSSSNGSWQLQLYDDEQENSGTLLYWQILFDNGDCHPCSSVTIANAISICEDTSYLIGSSEYSTPGIYTDTLTSITGCDSIVVTTLQVFPVYNTSIPISLCAGEQYLVDGVEYTEAGIYTLAYTSISGCDSLINLELTLHYADTLTQEYWLCTGDLLVVENDTLYAEGSYTHTYISNQGCMGMIYTALHIQGHTPIILFQEICEGDTYNVNGHSYSMAGTYADTLLSAAGCDSIVHIQLSIQESYHITHPVSICDGDVYTIAGHSYSTPGIYLDSLLSSYLCDSIVTTHLTILPTYNVEFTEALCKGEVYTIDGHNFTQDGDSYTHTYTDMAGCDSTITLLFSFLDTSLHIIPHIVCAGDSIGLNGIYFHSDTILTTLFTGQNGCDSTLEEQLFFTQSWYEIFDSICPGEEYPFGPETLVYQGDYSYTFISNEGCDSLVSLHLHYRDCPVYFPSGFSPNGDGINDEARIIGPPLKDLTLCIYNRWGQKVYETHQSYAGWDGKFRGQDQDIGVYVFNLTATSFSGKRLQIKGNLTLVR